MLLIKDECLDIQDKDTVYTFVAVISRK